MRFETWGRLETAPRWILAITGIYLMLGLPLLYASHALSEVLSLQISSANSDSLFVTAAAALGFAFCLVVLRRFPAGAPLRSAWLCITLAAAARAASGLSGQVLGTNWLLNPLTWAGAPPAQLERIHTCAELVSGPVQLALLAVGLWQALRILRKFGFSSLPTYRAWTLTGIAVLFLSSRTTEAILGTLPGNGLVALVSLPVLCVLTLEAGLLLDAAAKMGRGPIARCWRAFAIGILLTGLGEIVGWAMQHNAAPWPLVILQWCILSPAAVAMALAPAYQVAAQSLALRPRTPERSGSVSEPWRAPASAARPAGA